MPFLHASNSCRGGHWRNDKGTPYTMSMLTVLLCICPHSSQALLDIYVKTDHTDDHAHAREYNRLLKLAVTTKIDDVMKIQCLRKTNPLPLPVDLLHAVARSTSFRNEVLLACDEGNNFNKQLLTHLDECGNTALHIAAMSKQRCSETLVRNLAEKTLQATETLPKKTIQVHRNDFLTNKSHETPFALVLKHNHSEKELRQNKVMILLKSGYNPTLNDLKLGCKQTDGDDFKSLFLSADVISQSKDPIRFLLALGSYCQHRFNEETQCQSSASKKTKQRIQKQESVEELNGERTNASQAMSETGTAMFH